MLDYIQMSELFHTVANRISSWAGSPWAFILALTVIIIWVFAGPSFGYSDTWQLVINTSTTIVTFLMVFLIQNTQNRDSKAIHVKLDELLKGVKGARTSLVNVEDVPDEELEKFHSEFQQLHEKYAQEIQRRSSKKSSS